VGKSGMRVSPLPNYCARRAPISPLRGIVPPR